MKDQQASDLIKKVGLSHGCVDEKYSPGRWIIEAVQQAVLAEREACAKVCELRGRALETARAHADGCLQGADPKYFGPLLTLAADLAAKIRMRSNVPK